MIWTCAADDCESRPVWVYVAVTFHASALDSISEAASDKFSQSVPVVSPLSSVIFKVVLSCVNFLLQTIVALSALYSVLQGNSSVLIS